MFKTQKAPKVKMYPTSETGVCKVYANDQGQSIGQQKRTINLHLIKIGWKAIRWERTVNNIPYCFAKMA